MNCLFGCAADSGVQFQDFGMMPTPDLIGCSWWKAIYLSRTPGSDQARLDRSIGVEA
jgi:hypothetical protein